MNQGRHGTARKSTRVNDGKATIHGKSDSPDWVSKNRLIPFYAFHTMQAVGEPVLPQVCISEHPSEQHLALNAKHVIGSCDPEPPTSATRVRFSHTGQSADRRAHRQHGLRWYQLFRGHLAPLAESW